MKVCKPSLDIVNVDIFLRAVSDGLLTFQFDGERTLVEKEER